MKGTRISAAVAVALALVLNLGTVQADQSPVFQAVAATYKLRSPDYSCTATAIKTDGVSTYFLTARHCTTPVQMKNGKKVFLDDGVEPKLTVAQPGQQAIPVTVVLRGSTAEHDWAILEGAYAAPNVIPLSGLSPFLGEQIVVAGYPYGLGPVVTEGTVSSTGLNTADIPSQMFSIYVYGAPGNSGSAVIDEGTMTIIGILDAAVIDGQGDPALILADPVSDLSPDALKAAE